MKINSLEQMQDFGAKIGQVIQAPTIIELIGDVGAGKTTLTQGIATGLGIKSVITSPSFTISKRYPIAQGELVHYDFYRLNDIGLMLDELNEVINSGNNIVIIEWAQSAADVLPSERHIIKIVLKPDGSRELELDSGLMEKLSQA